MQNWNNINNLTIKGATSYQINSITPTTTSHNMPTLEDRMGTILVDPNEIKIANPSQKDITAVGVDGCTVAFLWTPDKLVCIHAQAGPMNLRHQMYKGAIRVKKDRVTDICIVAPDRGDLAIAKEELKKLFPRVIPREETYLFTMVAKAKSEWWDIDGNLDFPGIVNIAHETEDN